MRLHRFVVHRHLPNDSLREVGCGHRPFSCCMQHVKTIKILQWKGVDTGSHSSFRLPSSNVFEQFRTGLFIQPHYLILRILLPPPEKLGILHKADS